MSIIVVATVARTPHRTLTRYRNGSEWLLGIFRTYIVHQWVSSNAVGSIGVFIGPGWLLAAAN